MTWEFKPNLNWENYNYFRDNFDMPTGSIYLGKNCWQVEYPTGCFIDKEKNISLVYNIMTRKINKKYLKSLDDLLEVKNNNSLFILFNCRSSYDFDVEDFYLEKDKFTIKLSRYNNISQNSMDPYYYLRYANIVLNLNSEAI